jgi:hypothetical protein
VFISYQLDILNAFLDVTQDDDDIAQSEKTHSIKAFISWTALIFSAALFRIITCPAAQKHSATAQLKT